MAQNNLIIQPAKNNYNNTTTLTTSDILNSPELNDTKEFLSTLAPGSTGQDIAFMENPLIADSLKQYETAYDEQVKYYTDYFKQQYEQGQKSLAVAHQENLRRSAETSQGLSTGQTEISRENMRTGFEASKQQLAQNLSETAGEVLTQLQSNFAETLTNIFGEITEDGRFSKLVEYTEMADIATSALWDVAAENLLNVFTLPALSLTSEYVKDGKITDSVAFLAEQGILALDINANGYYLTDTGYEYIDELLNSEWSINTDTSKDGVTVYDEIIDKMIDAEYDIDTQANWTDIKREQIREKYIDFLVDFGQPWRYTHIGLWQNKNNKIEIDMIYSDAEYSESPSDKKNQEIFSEGIKTKLTNTSALDDASELAGVPLDIDFTEVSSRILDAGYSDLQKLGEEMYRDLIGAHSDSTVEKYISLVYGLDIDLNMVNDNDWEDHLMKLSNLFRNNSYKWI